MQTNDHINRQHNVPYNAERLCTWPRHDKTSSGGTNEARPLNKHYNPGYEGLVPNPTRLVYFIVNIYPRFFLLFGLSFEPLFHPRDLGSLIPRSILMPIDFQVWAWGLIEFFFFTVMRCSLPWNRVPRANFWENTPADTRWKRRIPLKSFLESLIAAWGGLLT